LGDTREIHLSAIRLLAPHLTPENHADALREASHKSKREVEHIVARLQPQPDVTSSVRRLPPPRTTPASVQPRTPESQQVAIAARPAVVPSAPRSEVAPLAPERYKVQFTVGRETFEKLRRVQDLLRHRVPSGDPGAIFDRALTALLADLERTKLAATDRPRATRASSGRSRHIPAGLKRAVWARDGGQCAFVGTSGRCTERGFLEFHHVEPYAAGGPTTVENLELRCRSHNVYEAEQYFGPLLLREIPASWSGPTRSGPD
jgi:HNH endonuclease